MPDSFKNMESKRQKKVARLLQRELGDLFMRNSEWVNGEFVTVTIVRVTPDLGLARVYLSFLKHENAEATMEGLEEYEVRIRHALAQRVRNQFRKLPELEFYVDDTQQEVQRIENILSKLDIPDQDEEEKD